MQTLPGTRVVLLKLKKAAENWEFYNNSCKLPPASFDDKISKFFIANYGIDMNGVADDFKITVHDEKKFAMFLLKF